MLYSATNPLLFRPGLRKNFMEGYTDFPDQWPGFLNRGKADGPEISSSIISGPSRLFELGDGEPITYEDPKMGPKAMAVDKEFGLGIIISRQAIEDDLYGIANQHAKWLGEATRLTYEYRAAAFLDDAFTGTYFKGWDGLPWLSTSHTLLNSGSLFGNRPATDVGLSITGITALRDLMKHAVNQNGDPVQMNPKTLVIGNNAGDEQRAWQIFNSTLEPYTAENQENAIKHFMPSIKVVTSVYKTNSKSYFLIDDKYNDAFLDVRRAPEYAETTDFDTGAYKYKVTTRFRVYGFNPYGWFGANPT